MSEPQDRDQEQGAGQPTGEGVASERVITGVAASEADPHGASMVAAVGDETGVKAVAAMATDYFNTVLVADFADDREANAAYLALLEADVRGILRIDGVLTAHADEQGKVNIDKLTEHSTRTGVKWGAAAGLAVGILFPPAIIGSVVGWGSQVVFWASCATCTTGTRSRTHSTARWSPTTPASSRSSTGSTWTR